MVGRHKKCRARYSISTHGSTPPENMTREELEAMPQKTDDTLQAMLHNPTF